MNTTNFYETIDKVIATIAIFPYHGMPMTDPKLTFHTKERNSNESERHHNRCGSNVNDTTKGNQPGSMF